MKGEGNVTFITLLSFKSIIIKKNYKYETIIPFFFVYHNSFFCR
jgi:hypothetical protein